MGTKTQVPAHRGWFTLDPDAPALLGHPVPVVRRRYFFPRETLLLQEPRLPRPRVRRGRAVPHRHRLVVHQQLLQAAAARTGRPTRSCPTPSPRSSSTSEKMVVLGQVVPGVDLDDLHAGQRGRAGARTRCTRTTSTSTWCGSGSPWPGASDGGGPMSAEHEVAVLGCGHAPVGQVGPQLRRVRHRGRRRPRWPTPGSSGTTSASSPAPTPSATATPASSPAPP